MPRKEEVTYYKFNELSKEAKEKAIENWREERHDFDDYDAKALSDFFKELLTEKGFDDDVEVYWSLGYTQGDGVCFKGRLEPEKFLDQEGFRKYKEMAPYIYIKVDQSGRNCHWNSMNVEIELEPQNPEDLLSPELRDKFDEVEYENRRIVRSYQEVLSEWGKERYRPVKEWEARMKALPKGPFEWMPDSESPAPLDIPRPEEPEQLPLPGNVKRALEAAKRKIERFEAKLKDLEEDVEEWVKDTSKELEKIGYDEIEYKGSDEVISDTLIANDYEFEEDGTWIG